MGKELLTDNMIIVLHNTLLGMGIVFVVLIIIILFISLLRFISKLLGKSVGNVPGENDRKNSKNNSSMNMNSNDFNYDNALDRSKNNLIDFKKEIIGNQSHESDFVKDTELVAVITAALMAYLGDEVPKDGLIVRNIRRSCTSNWQRSE